MFTNRPERRNSLISFDEKVNYWDACFAGELPSANGGIGVGNLAHRPDMA